MGTRAAGLPEASAPPARRQGCFPEAEKDPVIQIASMVTEHGSDRPLVRNVMTLGSCAPIVGSEVMSFSTEEELLKARRGTLACLACAGLPATRPPCATSRLPHAGIREAPNLPVWGGGLQDLQLTHKPVCKPWCMARRLHTSCSSSSSSTPPQALPGCRAVGCAPAHEVAPAAAAQRWRDLLVETDADVVIGYNICNFDLPYLIKRAETLKVSTFPFWGRIRKRRAPGPASCPGRGLPGGAQQALCGVPRIAAQLVGCM